MVTYQDIVQNETVKIYIRKADETLAALGYTEHSFAHVGIVAKEAGRILEALGYPEREQELAQIAGYLHDIGNVINRVDHAQSGAVMAFRILDQMCMEPVEIATVIAAIGNHDEKTAFPVNPVAAALILADKTDVRRSRVRSKDTIALDIHDRVNYSVVKAENVIKKENKELEHRAVSVLGRRVRILKTAKKKVVELAYSDDDDLAELLKSICGGDFFADND